MALLELFGVGLPLIFSTGPGPIQDRLLYVEPTEFGILNADNSTTYAVGTGFTWDAASNSVGSGTITEFRHYDPQGRYIDRLTGLNQEVTQFEDWFAYGNPFFNLLTGDDTLSASIRANGTVVNDYLNGWDGNDIVTGGTGYDVLEGARGDDSISGEDGSDRLTGDSSVAAGGNDKLSGGNGNDWLYGGGGSDLMSGGPGTDTAVFAVPFKKLTIQSLGAGRLQVTSRYGTVKLSAIERIAADDGIFTRNTAGGWTRVSSVPGMLAFMTWSRVVGTDAGNTIEIHGYDNPLHAAVIDARAGNDTINVVSPVRDTFVYGGVGDDSIRMSPATSGATTYMFGGDGNDTISALLCLEHDIADGGAGDDTISGQGSCELAGGTGSDLFAFTAPVFGLPGPNPVPGSFGQHVVTDFRLGIDHLKLTIPYASATSLAQSAAGLMVTVTPASLPNVTSTILLQGLNAPNAKLNDLLAP